MTAAHTTKTVNLALQGGGAHGAFTWGVLDRLLDEDRLVIEGISGTSAGAMNAAMLKTGYLEGGNEGADVPVKRRYARPDQRQPVPRLAEGLLARSRPVRRRYLSRTRPAYAGHAPANALSA